MRFSSARARNLSTSATGHTTTPSASATTRSPSLTCTPPMTTSPPTRPMPSLRLATGVVPLAPTGKPAAPTARQARIRPSVTTATIPARSSSAATRSPRMAFVDSPAPATTSTVPGAGTRPGASRIGELSSRPTATTRAGPATVAAGDSARIHGGSAPRPAAPSAASVLDNQSGGCVTRLSSRHGVVHRVRGLLRPRLVPPRTRRHQAVGRHHRRRGPGLRRRALARNRRADDRRHARLRVRPLRPGQPALHRPRRAPTDLPRLPPTGQPAPAALRLPVVARCRCARRVVDPWLRVRVGDADLALESVGVAEEHAEDGAEVGDEAVRGSALHQPAADLVERLDRLRVEAEMVDASAAEHRRLLLVLGVALELEHVQVR